ncbi:YitT family protein [Cohnella abietis]|uniref:Membrane protein n=1 Tax=Cohnella abietis TaxID=2507935 RepID=A0A3T1D1Y8_9BACL|nr:YitT family protein [Cohnella abietis]BBI32127.1 membrane protein [Cohnella abietis]
MSTMRVSYRIPFVIIGSLLSAVGLELFLVPHNMLVGGVTGVSVLFSYFTEMRLGLLLFLLNLPFVLFRYRQFDSQTRLMTFGGLSILSLGAFFLHPTPPLIDNSFAAAVAGGVALGVGIGMVLRYGGFVDASDSVAMLAKPKNMGKTGKGLWVFNGGVLLAGGFVFGWDEAMYSIIAFLLAYRMTDFSMNGFNLTRMVWVSSESGKEISDVLRSRFGKEVVFLENTEGTGTRQRKLMLYTVNRLEQPRIMREIRGLDPECSVATHIAHR